MSIRAIDWAFKQKVGSHAAKLILIKLADNANDEGFCWPSMDYIAEHCEMLRNNIPRYIKQLESQGLLRIEHRRDGTATLSNVYHLAILRGVSSQREQGVIRVMTGGCHQGDDVTVRRLEPSGNRHKDPADKSADQRFLRFWESYPKKVGKGAAERAWKKIRFQNGLYEQILTAVEAQRGAAQWQKDGGQYIPNPATWLNQKRWDDEVTAEQHTETVEEVMARQEREGKKPSWA